MAYRLKAIPETPRLCRLGKCCRAQKKGCERPDDDIPHRFSSFLFLSEPTTSGIVDELRLTKQIL
jgi:hypothetical protein